MKITTVGFVCMLLAYGIGLGCYIFMLHALTVDRETTSQLHAQIDNMHAAMGASHLSGEVIFCSTR